MSDPLRCYRCGASLEALSLPLTRQDQCPDCTVYLHCCRMCAYFDAGITEQCAEDDAEEVKHKEGANFCEYFRPNPGAHDPRYRSGDTRARSQLDTLFCSEGDDSRTDATDDDDENTLGGAEDLFR